MKIEQYFENPNSPSPSFPHAFSGNPGGFRTGPPIKPFGGDDFGSPIFTAAPLSKEITKVTVLAGLRSQNSALRILALSAAIFSDFLPSDF
jgi:hypothetical protein